MKSGSEIPLHRVRGGKGCLEILEPAILGKEEFRAVTPREPRTPFSSDVRVVGCVDSGDWVSALRERRARVERTVVIASSNESLARLPHSLRFNRSIFAPVFSIITVAC